MSTHGDFHDLMDERDKLRDPLNNTSPEASDGKNRLLARKNGVIGPHPVDFERTEPARP